MRPENSDPANVAGTEAEDAEIEPELKSSHDAEADDSAIEADRKSNSLDSQQDRSVAESALEPDEGAIA
ncbi:MAG: hypothetical protein ACRDT8_15210, partial [Micromonosporaceae bacterium]